MSAVDRILAAIDVGLQEAGDDSYGEIAYTSAPVCVRCRSDVEDGGLCWPCRAFMLGDSDDDPRAPSITHRRIEAAIWRSQHIRVGQMYRVDFDGDGNVTATHVA